jgi:hypothetical protein
MCDLNILGTCTISQNWGVTNFHTKQDGGSKLSLTIKNNWSLGWMKAWFYYRVPCRRSSEGEKNMFALWLWMSALDYSMEPAADFPHNDVNDAAFMRATTTIGGHDAVE